MRRSSLILSIALAAAALASGAQADTVTLKVGGTYDAGSDPDLAASGPVSGFLTFDTTPIDRAGAWTFKLVSGDIVFGVPGASYDFIIDGASAATYAGQSSSFNVLNLFSGDNGLVLTYDGPGTDPGQFYSFANTPANAFFRFSYSNTAFSDAVGGTFALPPSPNYYPTASLTLTTQTALGAVPEPATWALMIGGFGLAGAALRRRRTDVAAA